MSDNSKNLKMPFLLASQTQKHAAFNELVNKIDAILMLEVVSKTQSIAPLSPIEGQRYIVAPNANGEWQGRSGMIAVYQNLGWDYIIPKNGFIGFVSDENQFYIYNNAWLKLSETIAAPVSLEKLGIGTLPDANNILSAKLNNALFSAKYINEGGDGNIRIKVNKANTNNTASFIFQNDWSGRAEFGLIGDDGFALKTSIDGNAWLQPFKIDIATGRCSVASLNLPVYANGNNEYIRIGNDKFAHSYKAVGTNGKNLFLGQNAGNFTASYSSQGDDASNNTGIGFEALKAFTSGYNNAAFGASALGSNTNGFNNTALGFASAFCNISGQNNTAIGRGNLYVNTTGSENTANGAYSMFWNNTGGGNTASGYFALGNNSGGNYNTAIGHQALLFKIDGNANDAFSNCTGIGANCRVSNSNQVQLGGAGTTAYAFGAVQDRSDLRDKADIRDTILGLEFIKSLRPVDFKWDMRDDYFEEIVEIDEHGNECKTIKTIAKDGTKKRNRYHHGLIAQELKQVIDNMNIDFGGYQDHAVKGGSDVMTIGYNELFAPIIRSIQELSAEIVLLKEKQ